MAVLVVAACGGDHSLPRPRPTPTPSPGKRPVVRPTATARPSPFHSPTIEGYRIRARPLITIEPRSNPDYLFYDVHWRMTRALPVETGGATVKLDGASAEFVIPEGRRSRNCYLASVPIKDGTFPAGTPGNRVPGGRAGHGDPGAADVAAHAPDALRGTVSVLSSGFRRLRIHDSGVVVTGAGVVAKPARGRSPRGRGR